MTERTYINELTSMDRNDLCQVAVTKLEKLLEHCTLNMVCKLTGITRPTLYKWLDESIALDDMNHYYAAWFILNYETNPKIRMLLDRGYTSKPRLAGRVIEGESK